MTIENDWGLPSDEDPIKQNLCNNNMLQVKNQTGTGPDRTTQIDAHEIPEYLHGRSPCKSDSGYVPHGSVQQKSTIDNDVRNSIPTEENSIINITFSLISSSSGNLNKTISLNKDGGLVKIPVGNMTKGTHETITISFKEFPDFLNTLKPNQAITLGTCSSKYKNIVTSDVVNKNLDIKAIARTKEHFKFNNGEQVVLIDIDSGLSVEKLREGLNQIIPGFQEAAKVITPSSGSNIYLGDKNLTPNKGWHIYIVVKNASDIERFKEAAFKRSCLTGYGYIKISKAGTLLERSKLFDQFVFSPERLVFEAPPDLKEGLVSKKLPAAFKDGGLLDTTLCKDLTNAEEAELQKLVQELKTAAEPEAEKVRATYINDRVSEHKALAYLKKKPKDEWTDEDIANFNAAVTVFQAAIKMNLYGDFTVRLDALGDVIVKDIFANPEKHDQLTCHDPLEPDTGRNKAKLYWNNGDKPQIYSMLHGGRTFFLHADRPPWTYQEVMVWIEDAVKNPPADSDIIDTIKSIAENNVMQSDEWIKVKRALKKKLKVNHGEVNDIKKQVESKKRFALDTNDPLYKMFKKLNTKHAGVMIGGQYRIMNFFKNPLTGEDDFSLSSKADFCTRYEKYQMSSPNDRPRGLGEEWLQNKDRKDYDGLVFDPNEKISKNYYNMWKGFSITPRQGDWSLLKAHIRDVIASGDEDLFNYTLQWSARIFQDPGGERPGTALVLKGGQGTGKGIFVNALGTLIRQHFIQITNQNHLTGRFNSHLKDIILCFVDEGFWGGNKQTAGTLKGMITEKSHIVEFKGKDIVTVDNHLNLIIASNEDWVVPAGSDERRFCVFNVSNAHKTDHKYFGAIQKQMKSGGYEAMMYDLMNMKVDLNMLRTNIKTDALFKQKELGMSSVEKYWHERLASGYLHPYTEHSNPEKNNQSDWTHTIYIKKAEQHDNYIEYCDTMRLMTGRIGESVFGKKMMEMSPSMRLRRININSDQARCREFSSLDKCRLEFENYIGQSIDWGSDE